VRGDNFSVIGGLYYFCGGNCAHKNGRAPMKRPAACLPTDYWLEAVWVGLAAMLACWFSCWVIFCSALKSLARDAR